MKFNINFFFVFIKKTRYMQRDRALILNIFNKVLNFYYDMKRKRRKFLIIYQNFGVIFFSNLKKKEED